MYNKHMSTLLMHVAGSRLYNFTLFRPHLYIYDDRVVYKKRHLLTHDEFSISYNQIAQVNLIKFIYLFGHIEMVTSAGMRFIKVHWIPKGKAKKAKKIIEEKIHQAHRKDHHLPDDARDKGVYIKDFEKSLRRLKELLSTGKINQREFNRKRKQLLKKHY
jgi:hypothetical protein